MKLKLTLTVLYTFFTSFYYDTNDFKINEEEKPSSKAALKVSPWTNLRNNDFVEIAWTGVEDADFSDRIALVCGSEEKDDHIITLHKTHKSRNKVASKGKIKVQVFYHRMVCEYHYIKFDKDQRPSTVAESKPLIFVYTREDPMQIHIALTKMQDEMRIMWITGVPITSCVLYGKTKKLGKKRCGTSFTYKGEDMCEEPAKRDGFLHPGFFYDVLLNRLSPNQHYFYRIISNSTSSEIMSFTTRKSFSTSFPFSFYVFGDLSTRRTSGAAKTIAAIKSKLDSWEPPAFLLHVGDISYAKGMGHIWDEFGYLIEPVAAQLPYMVAIGNHEHVHKDGYENDPSGEIDNFIPVGPAAFGSGGECSVPMVNRFHMPDNGNKLFWFTFDYGLAKIIVLSSENNYTYGSPQHKWLISQLENTDRKVTPWLVVTMHRPMYSSLSKNEYHLTRLLRRSLEPLLLKHRIDFFINGHVHFYERTCPINNQECVKEEAFDDTWGIVHLTVGSGGMLDRPKALAKKEWSQQIFLTNGFGELTFINNSHASWCFIESKKNQTIETVLYQRNHNLMN